MQAGGSGIIVIDLNANQENITFSWETLIGARKWSDVGGSAGIWGGTDGLPTCAVAGKSPSTRRGYLFVHPQLLRELLKVKVHDDATFATHARVEATFHVNGSKFFTRAAKKNQHSA